jgi:hypothetical protein
LRTYYDNDDSGRRQAVPTEANAAVSNIPVADLREELTLGEDENGYYAFNGADNLEILWKKATC